MAINRNCSKYGNSENVCVTVHHSMYLVPLVTDIAPGYDHITSAIGGAHCGNLRRSTSYVM